MEELYSVHDVARLLKLSESTIYRHVESDTFPRMRVGVNIRFTKEQVKAFIEDRQDCRKKKPPYNGWY